MIRVEDQPCEVCGKTQSELIWTTTWPEHRYPGTFSMRRCTSCGLLFNSPRLDDAQLGELYGRNYYFFQRSDAQELARIVAMYQRTIALIEHAVPRKRSLDIGCGRGYFPAVLKAMNWDARGVEISPNAAGYARTHFGLDVFTGTIEQNAASEQARQFPLVTAIDVIEHVSSPRNFIEAMTEIVEPGGFAIIDTPNGASHNIAVKHIGWQGFNPFHVFLFTIENLKMLLESNGFQVERGFSYHNIPLDQTPEPLPRRVRDAAARNLKRVGLLGPAARAYFWLKGRSSSSNGSATQALLQQTVDAIRSGRPWDRTDDMRAPLAESNRGDNIVVIARRK